MTDAEPELRRCQARQAGERVATRSALKNREKLGGVRLFEG
jgi:hypothetical protein